MSGHDDAHRKAFEAIEKYRDDAAVSFDAWTLALEAAREEQRAVDEDVIRRVIALHMSAIDKDTLSGALNAIRATPLAATPLAERIKALTTQLDRIYALPGVSAQGGAVDVAECVEALIEHHEFCVTNAEQAGKEIGLDESADRIAALEAELARLAPFEKAAHYWKDNHDHEKNRHESTAAELAAESALVATLQDSLSAAQVAHHETAQERDRLKVDLFKAYTYGFVQGRAYEAMDTIEAMRTVGDFDTRRDAFIAACGGDGDPWDAADAALAATPGEPS